MRGRTDRALQAILAVTLLAAGWIVGGVLGLPSWLVGDGTVAETSTQQPAFSAPEAPAYGRARILLVGDVLPLEDRDYLASVRPLISAADLAVCNLECPLSAHGVKCPAKLDGHGRPLHGEFLFRGPPRQAHRLADAGFDAVTLANNHIMDYGGEALLESLPALDAAGLAHCGAGPDESEARRPAIARVGSQTIALLAYASARTLPDAPGFAATSQRAGTVLLAGRGDSPSRHARGMLRQDIGAAAGQADLVIVAFHWGTEGSDAPGALPRSLAHLAVDSGADLVIGHHPHVLQGVELYEGAAICYSLGNFVFRTPWEPNRDSAVVEVEIERGVWRRIVMRPVLLHERTGDPQPARGEDLERITRRIVRLSSELGTGCEVLEGPRRVVITNPEPEEPRGLLRAEEHCFTVEPHPDLEGMATVRFLCWDLEGERKVPRCRAVVVNAALASEVLEIFRCIYLDAERFPIHEVIGYDRRTVTGGARLSWHAAGRAIDINRAENPMIRDGQKLVHPDEPPYEPGEWRPGENPYSITPGGSVVRAFTSRGWRWGGEWSSCKDYQHFDRPQ
ncbi:MAG: CapA family protein [Armatimonadota bacterium]